MGYWLSCRPGNERVVIGQTTTKVGSYGCQPVFAGLWFAAYAAAGRPESKRVCGWIDPGVAVREGGPWPERNKPSSIRELIAYNGENGDVTAVCVIDQKNHGPTLGLKFKPVTDPVLGALVEFWQGMKDDLSDLWDNDACVRIANAMETVLPRLELSSWYENCVEAAQVFRHAALTGQSISGG